MEIKNGASALTGSACPQKAAALVFTASQVGQIHAAAKAYRRLIEIRATSPEWPEAYDEWRHRAEGVAVAAIHMLEATEVRHD